MQPSEIEQLTVEDFYRWVDEAQEQIRRESGGG